MPLLNIKLQKVCQRSGRSNRSELSTHIFHKLKDYFPVLRFQLCTHALVGEVSYLHKHGHNTVGIGYAVQFFGSGLSTHCIKKI